MGIEVAGHFPSACFHDKICRANTYNIVRCTEVNSPYQFHLACVKRRSTFPAQHVERVTEFFKSQLTAQDQSPSSMKSRDSLIEESRGVHLCELYV